MGLIDYWTPVKNRIVLCKVCPFVPVAGTYGSMICTWPTPACFHSLLLTKCDSISTHTTTTTSPNSCCVRNLLYTMKHRPQQKPRTPNQISQSVMSLWLSEAHMFRFVTWMHRLCVILRHVDIVRFVVHVLRLKLTIFTLHNIIVVALESLWWSMSRNTHIENQISHDVVMVIGTVCVLICYLNT